MKLNSKELRVSAPTEEELTNIKRNPITLVLDNVLDTYNIGSLFRLADAIAAEKIYLCGGTETPPSSRIHKSAVGTENWTPWVYKDSALEAVKELKANNVQIISVEQDERAISYKDLKFGDIFHFPAAIVLGHETDGVQKEVLDISDLIVELPMFGINKSFNVWGSAAVIAFKLLESI